MEKVLRNIETFKGFVVKTYGTVVFSVARFAVILLLSAGLNTEEFVKYTAILGLVVFVQWVLVSPICTSIQRDQCQNKSANQESSYLYPQLTFVLLSSVVVSILVSSYLNSVSLLVPVFIYSLGELLIALFKVFYNYEEKYQNLNNFLSKVEISRFLLVLALVASEQLSIDILMMGLGFVTVLIVVFWYLNCNRFLLEFSKSLLILKTYISDYQSNINIVILSIGSWTMFTLERLLIEYHGTLVSESEYQVYYIVISVFFNFLAVLGVVTTPKILNKDRSIVYLIDRIIPALIIFMYVFLMIFSFYDLFYLLVFLSGISVVVFGLLQVYLLSLKRERVWLPLLFFVPIAINEIYRRISEFGIDMLFWLLALKIIVISVIFLHIKTYEKSKDR